MLNKYRKGEKVSAQKMNTYGRQTLRSTPYEAGVSSPQGWTPLPQPRRRSVPSTEVKEEWIYGVKLTGSATAHINVGKVFWSGTWRDSPAADLTLTNNPCYIYANWQIGFAEPTIKQASTVPAPTASEINIILCKLSAVGGVFSIDEIWHRGAYYAETFLK